APLRLLLGGRRLGGGRRRLSGGGRLLGGEGLLVGDGLLLGDRLRGGGGLLDLRRGGLDDGRGRGHGLRLGRGRSERQHLADLLAADLRDVLRAAQQLQRRDG